VVPICSGVVVGGRNVCVVEVMEVVDDGFGYAVVVMEAVHGGFDRAELQAYAPTDEQYLECIASLQASLAPC
jgi:hypothetical protein